MDIEYDNEGNGYIIETYTQKTKVCPLTGQCAYYSDCDSVNCSEVNIDKYDIHHGQIYHCVHEFKEIEREFDRKIKSEIENIKANKRRSESLNLARQTNFEEFSSFCEMIDEYMCSNKLEYSEKLEIHPYCGEDDRFLVYWFENEEIKEICVTENLISNIFNRLTKFKDKENGYTMSYHIIPQYISEAVKVNLYLKYRMDVKGVLRDDNPVYIKESSMSRYMDSAYRWSKADFNKLRSKHLELTELVNYGSVIYIKQEIDEIIRRDGLLK